MTNTQIPHSQEEVYLNLYETLLLPFCKSRDAYFLSQSRKDFRTLKARTTSREGIQFLTKTLPKLGKAFDQGLVNNLFLCPREFGRSRKGSCIPAFLQAYFAQVFNEDGSVRDSIPPYVIKHIRQVCYFLYKLELPYSQADEDRVLTAFEKTEEEIVPTPDLSYLDLAASITDEVFEDFDPKAIVPKHGPGAVSTGEKGEGKWLFGRIFANIETVYTFTDFFMVGGSSELLDRWDFYSSLEWEVSGTTKVVLVPKDSRGPRIISSEPLEYMWLQQGLGRKLMDHLEGYFTTRGHINFRSQQINRDLALASSDPKLRATPAREFTQAWKDAGLTSYPPLQVDGGYVTLDLKDASDRVTLTLVNKVFEERPLLLECLKSLRSTETLLPSGKKISLRKFAPMGSALCFPVEAYIFWVIIVSAISRKRGLDPRFVSRFVYVYGDDIIVPKKYSDLAIQSLTECGLLVNTQKCCTSGDFRESCGMDAFRGNDVTPVKLKSRWSGSNRDASAFASYIALANNLDEMYKNTKEYLRDLIQETYGFVPYCLPNAGYIGFITTDRERVVRSLRRLSMRWDADIQSFKVRVRRLKNDDSESALDDWPRLLRGVTTGVGEDPSRVVDLKTTKISWGWTLVS